MLGNDCFIEHVFMIDGNQCVIHQSCKRGELFNEQGFEIRHVGLHGNLQVNKLHSRAVAQSSKEKGGNVVHATTTDLILERSISTVGEPLTPSGVAKTRQLKE